MLNSGSAAGSLMMLRYSWLSSPELGVASSSQAIAPRNGGVTNEAVTSARIVRRSGMSVRATSHPIGAATAQQMIADEVARMTVVTSGFRNVGSVTRRRKLSNVSAPVLSVTLK